mgnify:CR=1 FL=1
MIAFLVGVGLAGGLTATTGLRWALLVPFLVAAGLIQVVYAHKLNAHLGGIDPVEKFRAKNLSELKLFVHIPIAISALNFAARVLWWGSLAVIAISLNLIGGR